jgi:ankyrin repeat protein
MTILNISDLFINIRNGNIVEAIKFIESKTEEELDVNIRDDRGIYLIYYAVIQNNSELLTAIIKKNPILDITDTDGRSILYYPIKYNYKKVFSIILQYNRTNIGISILDIKDRNGNIPLHYAINYKNIEFVLLLLKENSNVNSSDENKNNALHLAIIIRDYNICKVIIESDIVINAKNISGETPLHLACNIGMINIVKLLLDSGSYIDIQDDDNELTPIHYAINTNNIPITKLLINYNANPNLQDITGNTPLHYIIVEEMHEIFEYILTYQPIKDKINMNIYNYENKLPIHIALEKKLIDCVSTLISGSNLNFQDIDGNTPLHYIFNNNIWKGVDTSLKKKKINIFVKNKKNLAPIDMVDKNDLGKVFDIVIASYLYIIRNYGSIWKENWENKCNKELFMDTLNDDELVDVQKYGTFKGGENEDICSTIIKKKIEMLYKNTEKGYSCSTSSYPVKKNKLCINLDNTSSVEVCSFTGITLDVLTGLIYLLKKYKFAGSVVNNNFAENKDLCDYYKSIGILAKSKCEFLNFEIIWIQQKLHLSTEFEVNFIKNMAKPNIKFIIIPLGIELRTGSHANYLVYNKKANELERFEPYGSSPPPNFNYNSDLLDKILGNRFIKLVKDIKYIRPIDYLPKISFQYLESVEKKSNKIGDPGGFCALWAIWYVDQRLSYYDVDRKQLVNKMIKEIKLRNISFKDLIRNYSKNILTVRDKIFKKAGITINDWLNDQYSDDQINLVIKEITNIIENVAK